MEAVLRRERSPGGLLNPDWTDRLMREHISGKANHRKALWSAIVLELWRSGPYGPGGDRRGLVSISRTRIKAGLVDGMGLSFNAPSERPVRIRAPSGSSGDRGLSTRCCPRLAASDWRRRGLRCASGLIREPQFPNGETSRWALD